MRERKRKNGAALVRDPSPPLDPQTRAHLLWSLRQPHHLLYLQDRVVVKDTGSGSKGLGWNSRSLHFSQAHFHIHEMELKVESSAWGCYGDLTAHSLQSS